MAAKCFVRRLATSIVFACGAATLLTACDVNKFAANQTVKVIEAGSMGAAAFWDYEAAGQAMPSSMLQGEALLRVTPENEKLLLGLAQTYVSYAYGWLQLDWEKADFAGDFETADELGRRIRHFNLRAKKLALRALEGRDDDERLEEVLATRDAKRVRAYVERVFDDEEDVPALYWAGLSWGSVMASPGGSVDEVADAPLAVVLIERSIALDPTFQDGGGYSLLGTVEAAFPELFGGNLKKAREYYEKAIAIAERKNHLTLVGFARSYAVAAQDRELFVSLLREVLDAPDQGNSYRLVNKVAKMRAQFYLKRVDDWFLPPAP